MLGMLGEAEVEEMRSALGVLELEERARSFAASLGRAIRIREEERVYGSVEGPFLPAGGCGIPGCCHMETADGSGYWPRMQAGTDEEHGQ